MTEIQIKKLNDEPDIWDEFVKDCDQGTIFHTYGWLKIINKHDDKFTLEMLGGYYGQELIGVFPLFIRYGKWINHAVSPLLPIFSPYGGPLFNSINRNQNSIESIIFGFISAVEQYLSEKKVNHMHFITTFPFEDVRIFNWNGYNNLSPKYTYVLNLKQSKDEILQNMEKNKRYNIIRGLKNKKIILKKIQPSEEFIDAFWSLMIKTHERSNIKVPSIKKILSELILTYPANISIHAGFYESKIVAIDINVHFNYKIHTLLAASDRDFLKHNIPNLLLWDEIQSGIENGYKSMDLVGANVPSIAKFKAGFNPTLQIYYQIEKSSLFPFNQIDRTCLILKDRLYSLMK